MFFFRLARNNSENSFIPSSVLTVKMISLVFITAMATNILFTFQQHLTASSHSRHLLTNYSSIYNPLRMRMMHLHLPSSRRSRSDDRDILLDTMDTSNTFKRIPLDGILSSFRNFAAKALIPNHDELMSFEEFFTTNSLWEYGCLKIMDFRGDLIQVASTIILNCSVIRGGVGRLMIRPDTRILDDFPKRLSDMKRSFIGQHSDALSNQCSSDMNSVIEGLASSETWSLKSKLFSTLYMPIELISIS